jgi:Tol biopolymer transport system component
MPAAATFSGRNGVISFIRQGDCSHTAIYTVKPNGKRLRRVTPREGCQAVSSQQPTWSPDGRRMLFLQSKSTCPECVDTSNLISARPDGSRAQIVGEGVATPFWAPDGERLAWVYTAVHVGTLMEQEQVLLARGRDPSWSPDGRHVAMIEESGRDRDCANSIGVFDSESGARVRTLFAGRSENPDFCYWPTAVDWSPDGKRLLYNRAYAKSGRGGIFVMKPSGRGSRLIRRRAGTAIWSPDGRFIAFLRKPERAVEPAYGADLYVMRSDGTHVRRIARNARQIAWQPRPRD